jgi:ABC-type multidrug transport system ATPase subunit
VELVANPSIIFMDEPTSGLDARAAAIVMRAVRNTVDTGRTVVCTSHQPSIDIFEAFDEVGVISPRNTFCTSLSFRDFFFSKTQESCTSLY